MSRLALTAAVAVLTLAGGCTHATRAPAPASASASASALTSAPSSGPAPSAWPFPSAPAVGDVVSTGLVISGEELLLAMWGDGSRVLIVWRDTKTATLRRPADDGGADWEPCNPADRNGSFRTIVQLVTKDGRLLDVGVAADDIGGVTVEQHGNRTSAGIAHWSRDQTLVMFWNIRTGTPVTFDTAEAERPAYITTGRDGRQLDRRVFARCQPPAPGA